MIFPEGGGLWRLSRKLFFWILFILSNQGEPGCIFSDAIFQEGLWLREYLKRRGWGHWFRAHTPQGLLKENRTLTLGKQRPEWDSKADLYFNRTFTRRTGVSDSALLPGVRRSVQKMLFSWRGIFLSRRPGPLPLTLTLNLTLGLSLTPTHSLSR